MSTVTDPRRVSVRGRDTGRDERENVKITKQREETTALHREVTVGDLSLLVIHVN